MVVTLWDDFKKWQKECRWVDLSCEVSPQTQCFSSFPAMSMQRLFNVAEHGFATDLHCLVGQYGTHLDAPSHFVSGARDLEAISVEELLLPLCVIDKSREVAENPDFVLRAAHIEEWEQEHGRIPAASFVAFRSDWHKRHAGGDMYNRDAAGAGHTPGWGLDALKLLCEDRKVGAVGHETFDTDSALDCARDGLKGELYLLGRDRFQVEVLVNLDQCPPTGALIFCGVPKVKGATGFAARCFALCPR